MDWQRLRRRRRRHGGRVLHGFGDAAPRSRWHDNRGGHCAAAIASDGEDPEEAVVLRGGEGRRGGSGSARAILTEAGHGAELVHFICGGDFDRTALAPAFGEEQ